MKQKKSDKVVNFLKNLENVDFYFLSQLVNIANTIRGVMQDFKVTEEQFAKYFNISKKKVRGWRNGAKDFNVKDLAKLEQFISELRRERYEKLKNKETDIIQIKMDAETK